MEVSMTEAAQTHAVAVPPEVAAFAAEQGVGGCLPAVLEMTRRTFPGSAPGVFVEDDPEIGNDRHIVVAVGRQHMGVEQALEARYQWHRGLFACCPAPLVCVFRLGLELRSPNFP
jgi:hypothetical protein